ncbi:MAG: hypothetical protein ACM3SX_15560 [Deltaproteobacteria bacterium]
MSTDLRSRDTTLLLRAARLSKQTQAPIRLAAVITFEHEGMYR